LFGLRGWRTHAPARGPGGRRCSVVRPHHIGNTGWRSNFPEAPDYGSHRNADVRRTMQSRPRVARLLASRSGIGGDGHAQDDNLFFVIARSAATKQPIVLASRIGNVRAAALPCRTSTRGRWVASDALPPRNDNQIWLQVIPVALGIDLFRHCEAPAGAVAIHRGQKKPALRHRWIATAPPGRRDDDYGLTSTPIGRSR
jgi:hypothetical protein